MSDEDNSLPINTTTDAAVNAVTAASATAPTVTSTASVVPVSSSTAPAAITDTNQWRERIRSVQTQRMSPEAFQALRARADRQKEVERARQTASFLERCSHVSKRAQTTNLARSSSLSVQQEQQQQQQQRGAASRRAYDITEAGVFRFASAPVTATATAAAAPAAEVERAYERMASMNASRSATMRSILSPVVPMSMSSVPMRVALRKRPNAQERESENDEEEEEEEEDDYVALSAARNETLNALEEEIAAEERDLLAHAPLTAATTAATTSGASSDFDALLQSLAVEPTDAAETVAKFSIYETFLETVVAIREQTVALWNESREQFEETARRAGDQEIRRIDCAETMSVFENTGYSRRWFVYDMMKKAHQNHALISRILASIRGKLELLAQEGLDCPFCLDAITVENTLVLGCCHKTCKTCWAHWQQLKGGRAFCPLCRHREFVVEILA